VARKKPDAKPAKAPRKPRAPRKTKAEAKAPPAAESETIDEVDDVEQRGVQARAKIGRPSKFDPKYTAQAKKLCDRFGATDADLAAFFDVSTTAIKDWKIKHAEFAAALKVGKDAADDRVERSLFERAVGYSYDAVKIFMPKDAITPVYAPYVEHVPPDVNAATFWLNNRRKADWRQKVDHEHGGTVQVGVVVVPAKVPAVSRTLLTSTPTPLEKAEAVPMLQLPAKGAKDSR
jgi:hypothetical protein